MSSRRSPPNTSNKEPKVEGKETKDSNTSKEGESEEGSKGSSAGSPASNQETSTSVASSGSGTSSTSLSSNNSAPSATSTYSNPSSPRVTLRLPQGNQRAANEKNNRSDNKLSESSTEDPYEFKCSKDESSGGSNANVSLARDSDTTSSSQNKSSTDTEDKEANSGGVKRSIEEEDGGSGVSVEEVGKRKRRKEEGTPSSITKDSNNKGVNRGVRIQDKHSGKPLARASNLSNSSTSGSNGTNQSNFSAGNNSTGIKSLISASSNNTSQSSTTSTSAVNSASSSSDSNRKSPSLQQSNNSPKSNIKSDKSDDSISSQTPDDDSITTSTSGGGGPKVPPLKIVLSNCGGVAASGTNSNNTLEQDTKSSSSQMQPSNNNKCNLMLGANISTSSIMSSSSNSSSKSSGSNNKNLLYVVSSNISQGDKEVKGDNLSSHSVSSSDISKDSDAKDNVKESLNKESALCLKDEPASPSGSTGSNERSTQPRVTRSQRGCAGSGGNTNEDNNSLTVKSEVKAEAKPEEGGINASSNPPHASSHPPSHSSLPSSDSSNVHHRKRKLNIKDESTEQNDNIQSCSSASSSDPIQPQPVSNCYQMYQKIRKQIDDRRMLQYPIQSKPPTGYNDYVMIKGAYALAGNKEAESVIRLQPPQDLSKPLKELFEDQENERYKLRLQHRVERDRLFITIEQEICRVHGRAARVQTNQVLPFSACTLLREQEVYNILTPEQEEKHRGQRSRYNGRLFISWLQDVDDKWDKIKTSFVLRQQNEAESLVAVHRMVWEWKLKELGLCDNKTKKLEKIDDEHVPMVKVETI